MLVYPLKSKATETFAPEWPLRALHEHIALARSARVATGTRSRGMARVSMPLLATIVLLALSRLLTISISGRQTHVSRPHLSGLANGPGK